MVSISDTKEQATISLDKKQAGLLCLILRGYWNDSYRPYEAGVRTELTDFVYDLYKNMDNFSRKRDS